MFRSFTPRVRARQSVEDLTPPFDGYPYLVTRIGRSALRHIAVVPATWSHERLLALTRRQALANRLDTCLVLGPGHAVYVASDGAEYQAADLPTGSPVVERLRLAGRLPRTPEMQARRARLRAYADADDSPRYVVGDGLEAGRMAILDDLFRLGNLDGEDAHRGLSRCPSCGELAGDLKGSISRIRGAGPVACAPRWRKEAPCCSRSCTSWSAVSSEPEVTDDTRRTSSSWCSATS